MVEAQSLRRHPDELSEHGAQQNTPPDESPPGWL
jgi:hypothetical protein